MATTINPRTIEHISDVAQLKEVTAHLERLAIYSRAVLALRNQQIRTLPDREERRNVEDAALEVPDVISW
jgi:hypothetical protein